MDRFKEYYEKIKQIIFKHKGKLISAATVLLFLYLFKNKFYDRLIPFSQAMQMLKQDQINKAVVGSVFLYLQLSHPQSGIGYVLANRALIQEEELIARLQQTNITYSSPFINETQIGYALMLGIYSVVCFKIIWSMKDMHGFKGKEKKDNTLLQRTFEDVGGCNKAKDALKDIIDYIKNPDLYIQSGVRMPKGVLLYGPPGTGKTLIAKAAAAEAGVPVIYSSGSEFVEVYVGLGAKRIRDLFKQARAMSPCMIFIDEIDAVGYQRGSSNHIANGGHREMETTLNELLNQMDGFEENDRILVVAATNLASTLDPALQRPGRFDHKIEITLPDQGERKEIFKIHLKNKKHAITDEALNLAAQHTDGLAGAELENIVNLAALQSVRKAKSFKHTEVRLDASDFISYVTEFMNEKKKALLNQYPQQYRQHFYHQQ